MNSRNRFARYVPRSILVLYALVVLVPVVNLGLMSFKDYGEIVTSPIGLPSVWHWENYARAWGAGGLGQLIVNTVIVSVLSTLIVLICASTSAYVLARFAFRGAQPILLGYLAGLALPVQMLALPMFVVIRQLNLLNSLWALILCYAAAGMAFSVFLLINFVRSIPLSIDEAAYIDGAGPPTVFLRIILPLLRPALTTVAVFNLVAAWNGFFFPLVFIQDPQKMTVTVGVLSFVGQYGTEWDMLLPALVIVMLPAILVFIVASRQFTANMSSGAVKF